MAAVTAAAARLFAERGPNGVSLRDVADEANVNVGLIHRHIGTKEDLLAAVLRARPGAADFDRLRSEMPLAEYVTFLLGVSFDSVQARGLPMDSIAGMHGRAILDGYDLRKYQDSFPFVDHVVSELGARGLPDETARARAALVMALVVGWRLFGPAYLAIAGLDAVGSEEAAEWLSGAIRALVEAPDGA
ncbi:MAG TPA: helix-turn-helix domain-containing protein [Acidimicrobiales bacterium]|nr:helix-turn-helix domain-containing protein [Acidimicrobiales bacterium]